MAATATDEKLGADLASFRGEVAREFNGLAEFRGEVKNDLRWIKGIGMALLLAAFSFAGWVISDMATLKAEIRQHGARFDKIEKPLEHQGERLDRMEKQLDILVQRTAPKSP